MKPSKQVVEESLVNKVAKRCLHLFQGNNFKAWIQFWQTWTNMQAIPFIATSSFFTKDVQTAAAEKGSVEWTNFQMAAKGIPSVFKSIPGLFKNSNFWDPTNKAIIWDDRLWLGNSYLFLYNIFRVERYLMVATELYKFILKSCADWRADNYRGLQWKPGTDYRNSITNQLFLVFCCRLYHITRQSSYLDAAKVQYKLLFGQSQKYINSNKLNIFPEALGPDGFYTHNQGVVLEGLAYLLLYGDNYQQYMSQLVRITTGMIEYFRNKNQHKLIMKEFVDGNQQSLRTASIYRSFVFRHLLHLFRVLPPQTFQDYNKKTPFLRTFILDNAQAMCKYENLSPCYDWEKYNDGIIHDYNAFNMLYVLLCAVQMYNINEVVVNGLRVTSDGNLDVSVGSNIRGVYISTFNFDGQGVYRRGQRRLVKTGTQSFKDLLRGEPLISRDNNRNIMELTVLMINNQEIPMVLVHIEGEASMFALIPDQFGEKIINNCIVRVKTPWFREGLLYHTKSQLFQVQLSLPLKAQLSPLSIGIV